MSGVLSAGRAVGAVADGAQPRASLSVLGRKVSAAAKNTITSQQVGGPPLAKSTVDAKGSAAKLIDHGTLVRAIDFEVKI